VGASALLAAGAFLALWAVAAVAARVDHLAKRGEGQVRWALFAALAALATAVGALALAPSLGDRVLRALVELAGVAAMLLSVLAVNLASRAGERRWARVAAPRGALATAILAVTLASLSLSRLSAPGSDARALLRREVTLVQTLVRGE
jgi:hypothetical protein